METWLMDDMDLRFVRFAQRVVGAGSARALQIIPPGLPKISSEWSLNSSGNPSERKGGFFSSTCRGLRRRVARPKGPRSRHDAPTL